VNFYDFSSSLNNHFGIRKKNKFYTPSRPTRGPKPPNPNPCTRARPGKIPAAASLYSLSPLFSLSLTPLSPLASLSTCRACSTRRAPCAFAQPAEQPPARRPSPAATPCPAHTAPHARALASAEPRPPATRTRPQAPCRAIPEREAASRARCREPRCPLLKPSSVRLGVNGD
jgi:hypothetical protein